MTIYSTMPVFPMNGLRKEIDRFFDEAFTTSGSGNWMPAVEAREDGAGFVFEYDLPGVSPSEVEVIAENGVLQVRGDRRVRELAEGERRLLGERSSGRFERSFRLPKSADAASIQANFSNGVLTIRVAKVAPAQPRRVPISVDEPARLHNGDN